MSLSLKKLLPGRKEAATGRQRKESKTTSPARENRLVRWYRETESELKKVVWPTRREWMNLTLIVVATTIATGMFLGLMDFIFERLILLIR